MTQQELIFALEKARSNYTRSRYVRALHSPLGPFLPKVMRRFDMTQGIQATTFWGGKFHSILPEDVSTHIWRSGYFDYSVCRTLIEFLKPGSTFLDIGAHMGFFSLLASYIVGPNGKVISVEAMPSTFDLLKKNIKRNRRFNNITLHQGAAFNEAVELEFSDFGIVASSLNTAFGARSHSNLIKNVRKVRVQAQTADTIVTSLGTPKIDLIKIDAESSEKFVLAGLAETLAKDRPIVIMEVGDISEVQGTPTAELINLLASKKYQAYEWSKGILNPFATVGPLPYANLTFLPAERVAA